MNSVLQQAYMQKALDLAQVGLGHVAPNPMVGCVVVYQDQIIGQGFHTQYGAPHAEVEALKNIHDPEILSKCQVYVTLEPCAHHGKTPPCASLLVEKGIKYVYVACLDPNPLVAGKGVAFLKEHGVQVTLGLLEAQAQELNKRFFTFHQKNRPYIILKWAETYNGYLNIIENKLQKPLAISHEYTQILSHQWRTQEQAILVGAQTVRIDNPQLTARKYAGKNPLRIVLSQDLKGLQNSYLMQDEHPTWFFCDSSTDIKTNHAHKKIISLPSQNTLQELCSYLHKQNIQSMIVEGGARVLNQFIEQGLWDEARVIHSTTAYSPLGDQAPVLVQKYLKKEEYKTDVIYYYKNT